MGEDKRIVLYDSVKETIDDIVDAHATSLYTCEYLTKDVLATGDDDGMIKIWDLRTKTCVYDVHEQKEGTVTDMTADVQKSFLCSTSNNGTLAVYDLRKPNSAKDKLSAMSDEMEEELNCLSFVKVGSQERGVPRLRHQRGHHPAVQERLVRRLQGQDHRPHPVHRDHGALTRRSWTSTRSSRAARTAGSGSAASSRTA